LLLLFTIAAASASEPCPSVEALVREASDAFSDAEVALARQLLAKAGEALSCQDEVVSRETLLDLYHLDALASVAAQDPKAALFAIIRAVTVDPDALPPVDVGPELLEQHRQWSLRLRDDRLWVQTTDPGARVWIDGREIAMVAEPIISGEHWVQWRRDEGWRNELLTLVDGPSPNGFPLLVSRPAARPSQPSVVPEADDDTTPTRRPKRWGLAVGTGAAVVGGGLIVGGAISESRFRRDPYDAAVYGGCASPQPCWTDEREARIRADARKTNALYLAGYVSMGIGFGAIGVDLAVHRTGVSGQVRGTW
jgi:hypothetical protein